MPKRLPDEHEAIEGAGIAIATAAGLLSSADLLADVGSYGIARSLAVLALEESVKARTLGAIAAAAAQGAAQASAMMTCGRSCTAVTGSGMLSA